MLFEFFLYFKQHFDTVDIILQQLREQVHSTTVTKNNRAYRFPLKKNEVGKSVTSFLNKPAEKAVPCFRNASDFFEE